jgi:hypothetical protein
MSCFRCFSGCRTKRGKGEKRREGSTAPASPAAASFPSTVSTGAPSNLTFSTASSAVVTSHSEDSSAVMRPEATKSSGSASVSSARSIPELYEERGASSLREFGFRELRAATSDFSRLLKVGEGGFGSVYKGVVRLPGGPAGGTVVAIKKLNPNGHQVWSCGSVVSWLTCVNTILSLLITNSSAFLQHICLPYTLSPSVCG